jgi:hypothetical protein
MPRGWARPGVVLGHRVEARRGAGRVVGHGDEPAGTTLIGVDAVAHHVRIVRHRCLLPITHVARATHLVLEHVPEMLEDPPSHRPIPREHVTFDPVGL